MTKYVLGLVSFEEWENHGPSWLVWTMSMDVGYRSLFNKISFVLKTEKKKKKRIP